MSKKILAIESSCDETAACLMDFSSGEMTYNFEIISNIVASQIELHKKWGGVYPELASRAHLEAIIPVLGEAIAPIGTIDNVKEIDSVAVTKEPGLIGSLLVGIGAAKFLGKYFDKPVSEINHLEGHIYSAFATSDKFQIPKQNIFPILALVVSGGHTSLILMKSHIEYETIGQTIDDAAGEAFDKVARIMELGYPGGPEIEKCAKNGNEDAYKLPLSMRNSKDLNFSFSGLKTAVLYLTKEPKTGRLLDYNKTDLAASFQKTVTEILIGKTIKAIEQYSPKSIILSGGVSANGYLREHFASRISAITDAQILIPPKNLSTDNAVGIAIAGAIRSFK